jgi:hypothetical protein
VGNPGRVFRIAGEVAETCRQRIEEQVAPGERANFLAVTQVLTRLRFPNPDLLALLGGHRIMIESPLIQEIEAKVRHKGIGTVLGARFGDVPADVTTLLQSILDGPRLDELMAAARSVAAWMSSASVS